MSTKTKGRGGGTKHGSGTYHLCSVEATGAIVSAVIVVTLAWPRNLQHGTGNRRGITIRRGLDTKATCCQMEEIFETS